VKTIFVAQVCLALFIGLSGCSTISTDLVVAREASADHSGIVEIIPDVGQIVNEHWRVRYNRLISKFGTKLNFPLSTDQGLVPDGKNYFVSKEYVTYFIEMNAMDKSK